MKNIACSLAGGNIQHYHKIIEKYSQKIKIVLYDY
jgi:hypothetical protein